MTGKPKKWSEQKFLREFAKLKSSKDLDALIGEITPEEQALIDSIDFDAPPTEEELAAMGPDFVKRVTERTLRFVRPFLSRLADEALSRFERYWSEVSSASVGEKRNKTFYSRFDAALDVVTRQRSSPHATFLRLIRETGETPRLLKGSPESSCWPMDSETWDQFYAKIAAEIVAREMRRRADDS